MTILKSNQIDFSKVTFSDVKKMGKGKMVYANLNGGKIILQTPKMNVPFGISRWRDDNADDNKGDSFRLGLSFYGEENNSEIKNFRESLSQFDEIIKQKIKENSKEWIGKPNISMELINEALYVPNVKVPKDSDGNVLDYPSRFEVKLDRQKNGDDFTGKFVSNKKFNHEILVYDDQKNLVELNENNYDTVIPKGSSVITIVELVYISITAKISCKWKLVQAKIFKNQKAITDYAIIDDDDDEDEEENDNVQNNELIDDLDSESEGGNVVAKEEDQEVEELAENLQEANLEEEVIEKPVKKGRKSKQT